MRVFHEEASVPVNSCLLLEDRAEAEAFPRGTLRLAWCPGCGFVGNVGFDPARAEYSPRYEETQAFSPRFVDFADRLAKQWVDTYDLHGRSVLEIGCGKGEFLQMMCEHGVGRGVGIDPGVNSERAVGPAAEHITWITDFYSQRYAHLEADAVVCRHTLEHIQPVGQFLATLRKAIGRRLDTVVLFEVPDVVRVLREAAFWDVYYEHCSYFSAGSLARLFRGSGFEVLDLSLAYDDQYLLVEARPATAAGGGRHFALEDDLRDLAEAVEHFSARLGERLDHGKAALQRMASAGGRAVIWGAGSKGVAYLNHLHARGAGGLIEYAVDINPHKHHRYMAGTGQQIVPPQFLIAYRPDLVVAMNPIYVEEIQHTLEGLGVDAEVAAL